MGRLAVTEAFVSANEGVGVWHGPAPRFATADEFGSYAELVFDLGFGYPGIVAHPTGIAAPAITVDVQLSGAAPLSAFGIYLQDTDGTTTGPDLLGGDGWTNSLVVADVPAGTWVSHTFHLTAGVDYNQAATEAALAAGRFTVLGWADPGDDRQFFSQIAASIGDTYLRNHARDDGVGANPPRNHTRTSQQRSLRNHGYR